MSSSTTNNGNDDDDDITGVGVERTRGEGVGKVRSHQALLATVKSPVLGKCKAGGRYCGIWRSPEQHQS